MQDGAADGDDTIQAVDRAFQVLDLVRELGGARFTEIANRLGWAKSTTHSHLQTLEQLGYLVQDGDEYDLGYKFVPLGEHAKRRKDIYAQAAEKVDELAQETGERVLFMIEEHAEAVYVHVSHGDDSIDASQDIGERKNIMHATAGGKCILSTYTADRIHDVLDRQGMPRFTPNTITDRDEFFRELDGITGRGYAFNNEEHMRGLRAVSAPVLGVDDLALGAISVAGPSNRMEGEWFTEQLPDLLLGATNELEVDMAYS